MKAVLRTVDWLMLLGAATIVLVGMLTVADIVLRAAFSHPLSFRSDVEKFLIAAAIAAGFPALIAERRHVAMMVFEGTVKRIAALRILITWGVLPFFTIAFFAIAAWQLLNHARHVYRTGQTMPLLAAPVWPVWAFVGACLVVGALMAVLAEIPMFRSTRREATAEESGRTR